MSVLVEGFTLVLVAQAIEECYRGGIDAFLDEMEDGSFACDGSLVRLGCRGRDHLRERLAHLAERGMPDAADLLRATETSERDLTPEESAELEAIHAGTTCVALVYRRQARCPPWLELLAGPAPGGGPDIAGCCPVGEEPGALAVPEGWSPEQVLPLRDEPEAGDERLPSWHEYLSSLRSENRAWAMQTGPEGVLSLMRGLGFGKPFAGPIRPAPNVIEQERVVRDPDGTEHTVLERWTKL